MGSYSSSPAVTCTLVCELESERHLGLLRCKQTRANKEMVVPKGGGGQVRNQNESLWKPQNFVTGEPAQLCHVRAQKGRIRTLRALDFLEGEVAPRTAPYC